MNSMQKIIILLMGFTLLLSLHAQDLSVLSNEPEIPETILRESFSSIQRGVDYLIEAQKKDGSWARHPAVTGICLMALHNSFTSKDVEKRKEAVKKGLSFIRKFVQKDGSIWPKGQEREYPNYTTAVALCALATINDPKDEAIMRAARKYLQGSQITDKKNPNFGGIGYTKAGPGKSDLSNTQWALEALYLTDYLDNEKNAKSPDDIKKSGVAWKNAVQFLSRLQHLPETNDQVWVVKDKEDPKYGGFIYETENLKAGNQKGLSCYGSMTYAGIKSMIYAKLDKDDPRVKAATEWGAKNYDLTKNPGIGPEGHYYYLHTFAKAHSTLGEDIVTTPDGKKHSWRIDLIKELLKSQKSKGEWYNEKSGRWWESSPELVTGYALLSLETALGSKIN